MSPSPSDVKNPGSAAHKANADNRARQIQGNKQGTGPVGSAQRPPTPNDQRANANNPGSAAHKANADNRSQQIQRNKESSKGK